MITFEARELVYTFAIADIRYTRILEEEPDLFKTSERKKEALEEYERTRKALFDYIGELEAKAGVQS